MKKSVNLVAASVMMLVLSACQTTKSPEQVNFEDTIAELTVMNCVSTNDRIYGAKKIRGVYHVFNTKILSDGWLRASIKIGNTVGGVYIQPKYQKIVCGDKGWKKYRNSPMDMRVDGMTGDLTLLVDYVDQNS